MPLVIIEKWYQTLPLLMPAEVWGMSSVRRMFWPFQYAVLVSEILAPCLDVVSAGFLYDGDRLTYSVTAPDPWM